MDHENYLTLKQAAARLPGRLHISTLHRWRLKGVRGVILQTCMIGGRRFTTMRWIDEFLNALTSDEAAKQSKPSLKTTPQDHISAAEEIVFGKPHKSA